MKKITTSGVLRLLMCLLVWPSMSVIATDFFHAYQNSDGREQEDSLNQESEDSEESYLEKLERQIAKEDYEVALFLACVYHNVPMVKFLIRHGVDVNTVFGHSFGFLISPLFLTTRVDERSFGEESLEIKSIFAVVEILGKIYLDVLAKNEEGLVMVENPGLEIAELLIAAGADAKFVAEAKGSGIKVTTLMSAIMAAVHKGRGQKAMVDLLIESGADVNSLEYWKNKGGEGSVTPLAAACYKWGSSDSKTIASALLEAGADEKVHITYPDGKEKTAFQMLLRKEFKNI